MDSIYETFDKRLYRLGDTPVAESSPFTDRLFGGELISEDGFLKEVTGGVASDTLQESADTERTNSSTSYSLKKEIRVGIGGTIRVTFELTEPTGTQTAYGRIYINGVAVGTERTTMSSSYVSFSEDISVNPFDLVQLYTKTSLGGNPAYSQNFRVYYDLSALAQTTVNTD